MLSPRRPRRRPFHLSIWHRHSIHGELFVHSDRTPAQPRKGAFARRPTSPKSAATAGITLSTVTSGRLHQTIGLYYHQIGALRSAGEIKIASEKQLKQPAGVKLRLFHSLPHGRANVTFSNLEYLRLDAASRLSKDSFMCLNALAQRNFFVVLAWRKYPTIASLNPLFRLGKFARFENP